ncbi:MAG TPA: pyrroline-5-carboxylate reductase [Rhodoglobus sp.]|nr:pyrroline-5-carboxylate reductase [Rhodoglobus sp.]HQA23207.1 pyrroline-5-carboxylate reductase [Rhodoglobus sp.]HQE46397.1 pyrroline-5-carboxylate reductase [Rhodoglobus sp.]HQI65480.1 pyrroline-5-carboxylate reductase [Rhodoglobus sp.]HQJ34552.1 pyrroline-5-carboxylate reductase [Rhodoglobus sp.]
MSTLGSIAIIGAGAMGGAILGGLLAPGVTVDGDIRVTNRTEAKAALVRRPGVDSVALETTPDGNALAVRGASVVIIGVKPAMVPETLAALAGDLAPDALVISVAAGVTTATMEAIVSQPVLRAMPNTPSLIGKGVTGLAAGSRATAEQVALGRAVFETVGTVVEVPESQIDALSTISGSGPAYVFYLVEQLTRTAVNLGFTPAQAAELVTGTFLGSVELLVASGREPEELRRQVTSPNGTTQRAIAELEKADLTGLFDRATASALARAKEMAEGR